MRINVLTLVRNEANRFLPSALRAWAEFADHIYVLDDSSTDHTRDVVKAAPKTTLFQRDSDLAWGQETHARKQLFSIGLANASPDSWLFVLDADMTPASAQIRDLFQTAHNIGAIAIALPLYDLWNQDENGTLWAREDEFWCAHHHHRVWAVKAPVTPQHGWLWSERGIHCGHFPTNVSPNKVCVLGHGIYSLLHYAYLTPKLRAAKHAQYMSIAPQLDDFEYTHADSILDKAPPLVRLPFTPSLTLSLEEE